METETIYGLIGFGLGIGVSYSYFKSKTNKMSNSISSILGSVNRINYSDRKQTLKLTDSLKNLRNIMYGKNRIIDSTIGINQYINSLEDKLTEEK